MFRKIKAPHLAASIYIYYNYLDFSVGRKSFKFSVTPQLLNPPLYSPHTVHKLWRAGLSNNSQVIESSFSNNSQAIESRLFKQFTSYGEAFQTIHKLLRAGFSNNLKVMESRLFKQFTSYGEQLF